MTDPYIEAAQSLILRLGAPAQFHSVWVQAEIDPETNRATGKKHLCVSIRPAQVNKIKVPESHMGIPVVQVPWPKGS